MKLTLTLILCCLVLPCFAAQSGKGVSESAIVTESVKRAIELTDSWSVENYVSGISIYIDLSETFRKQGDLSRSSEYLRDASVLKRRLGDSKSAIRLLQKSLTNERKTKNIDGVNETLGEMLDLYSNNGNSAASNRILKELLSNLNKQQENKSKANIYYLLGEIYYSREDSRNFFIHYSSALELYKKFNDDRGIAKTLLALSFAFLAIDDLGTGLRYAHEANSLSKTIGVLRGITLSFVAMGLANFRMGNSSDALELFSLAKMNFPEDVDVIERAILENNIGRVYQSNGDCDSAIPYFIKALEIFEDENNLTLAVGNLWTLGSVSYQCGQKDRALKFLKKSLLIAKTLGKKHDVIFSHVEIARVYEKENLLLAAEKQYSEALRLCLNADYKLAKAETLKGLGDLSMKAGDLTNSLKSYNSSLQLATEIKDRGLRSSVLVEMAKLDLTRNHYDGAIENISESIVLLESLYSDIVHANLQRSYLSSVYERYEVYISLLMQKHKETPNGDFAARSLQASETSRSRSLIESLRLSDASLTKDANPETLRKENAVRKLINTNSDKLNELLINGATKVEINKIEKEILGSQNDLETLKAELKQQSPIYSAIKNPPPFDVAEFQRNVLDDKTLLLEYSFGEKESYLWVVSKNEVSSAVLPARDVFEKRIDVLRNAIEERQKLSVDDPDAYLQRLAELENVFTTESKLLSNDLLGQVADKLAGKRLIVVPDGKLALLPISALPFPNSDEPMIAKNEIVYEPSASLLNILPNLQTRKQLPTKDLLVFADPVFSSSDSRLTAKSETESSVPNVAGLFNLNLRDFRILDSNGTIPRLPASQNEADSIAKTLGGNRTTIASGFDANRERVLNSDIGDYRMLHFATHGLIDMNRPEISSIVLSQFDEAGNKREGYLRLQDIYAMDLATDLVVLSACQSGVGKEIRGEGLMSLNNAFLQAGAKSVVSSAWKVDDNATAILMSKFYSNLIDKGLTTSEALRQAQIEMSKSTQYSSPFYWAAFTVQGEFRHPITVSTNYFGYVLFGLFGLVGLWIVWRFRKPKRY
jgi:CHAT domain-containing protein